MISTERKISPLQLKKLHTLLQATGQVAYKQDLMDTYCSDGRYPTSSKDLYFKEADAIIKFLEKLQRHQQSEEWKIGDSMRKKIISCCRERGWEISTDNGPKANMQRINEWVLKYGYLHKPLNNYTNAELPKLVTQAEQLRDSYLLGVFGEKK